MTFIAALMILGSAAASATTVPWSPIQLRAGSGIWSHRAGPNTNLTLTPGISRGNQAPETILYAFKGIPDGQFPSGQLIEDGDGSLYGTTQGGGLVFPSGNTIGGGTVFKLTPTRSGYTENVLYAFGASGADDGYYPWVGSRLVMDRTHALYGTTNEGGAFEGGSTACGGQGCGIVYKLKPTANGYTQTILHSFQGTSDGGFPASNPILDRSGALYGTTVGGGSSLFGGVVYKLAPVGSGYTFSVLYTFGASGANDGAQPYGPLLLDEKTGDLYGTTLYGGINQNGLVFRLRPTASGYSYAIIYSFHGFDGANPLASLTMDRAGALYGTAEAGGPASSKCSINGGTCGVVFKLTPASGGYNESTLYSFTGGLDGDAPASPLGVDRRGNLYSTASNGGQYGFGTVFELIRTPNGYREETLHAFNGNVDGFQASGTTSGVLLDRDYLVGETFGANKGPYANGNIFALKLEW